MVLGAIRPGLPMRQAAAESRDCITAAGCLDDARPGQSGRPATLATCTPASVVYESKSETGRPLSCAEPGQVGGGAKRFIFLARQAARAGLRTCITTRP